MEVDPLAERILSDINAIFKKVPLINEFDILPITEVVQNKCPVIHINQKVALEGWCVKHVYLYAYSQMMDWRHSKHKIDSSILLSWTRAVLLINPDVQTAWNIRKEIVFNGLHDIEEEISFSELVLSRKPKCPDAFAHRKLLLLKLKEAHSLNACAVEHEFEVCSRAAERYPNNYYAWSHRIWVIQKLLDGPREVALQELKTTESWVWSHISDHSGFHYRQFLITTCLEEATNFGLPNPPLLSRLQQIASDNKNNAISSFTAKDGIVIKKEVWSLLQQELVLISDIICTFPGHETLWYHRRFVVSALCHYCHSASYSLVPNCVILVDNGRVKKSKLELQSEVKFYIEEEEKFAKKFTHTHQEGDWQYHLAKRHVEWLRKVISALFVVL